MEHYTENTNESMDRLREEIHQQRQSPLTLAIRLRDLIRKTGMKQKELAKHLARSEAWVTRHLKLLEVNGLVRETLEAGLIRDADCASIFARLPQVEQENLVASAQAKGRVISRGACRCLLSKEGETSEQKENADETTSNDSVSDGDRCRALDFGKSS